MLLPFFSLLIIGCWISVAFGKRYFVPAAENLIKKLHPQWLKSIQKNHIFPHAVHLIPGVLLHLSAPFYLSYAGIGRLVLIMADVYVVFVCTLLLSAVLNTVIMLYERLAVSKKLPLRTTIQVVKIILFAISALLCLSVLLDRSFFGFFTGLGAAMALIMLVFKDTILGFVSSVQISFYDIIREGDRVTVPEYNADGHVEEISISTVKVRNFDKTITTMPTHALVAKGVRNGRAMEESGGRRIKRSINIDAGSIQFCDEALTQKLLNLPLLKKPLDAYMKEISKKKIEQLTSLEAFRLYTDAYIRQREDIHQSDFMLIVRLLAPCEFGVPIEIIAFTKETQLAGHEKTQTAIFNHLLAMLSLFELQMYQDLSQLDMMPLNTKA